MKGHYIILEGVVGSGKTTQADLLYNFLKKSNEVILTREPGGSEIAEAIRKLVQASKFDEDMLVECEAYLYAASRAQTISKIVKPVLEKGGIVVSDRSFISSMAYQGYARNLGINKVLEINKIALGEIFPNYVIYIELDPKIGLSRSFDKKGDKFEKQDVKFFKRVDAGYKIISQMPEFSNIWLTIDGRGNQETVFNRIKEKIMDVLPS